ncbi:STAS domain-containing protein, partial [Streptomyces hirsutus]|uniref:STAS domain-containing protein n=1 Tax=Streptomyces hirsutus TaxID=35620 RepID=UPI0033FCCD67
MDADRALLTPRGELVHGCADALARKLARLPARTARVDLDMSGVRFMDTAGLRFLEVLRDHGRRRSVPVTATGWTGQPRRILTLVGLDTTDPLRTPGRDRAPAPATAPAVALGGEGLEHAGLDAVGEGPAGVATAALTGGTR